MDYVISQFEATEMLHALKTGLHTDGAHHKQYYLEKALRYLVGKEDLEAIREDEGWDDGIPA